MASSKASSLGGGAGSSSMSALSRTAPRASALAAGGGSKGGAKKAPKLDAEQLEELKEAFSLFDTDNNGQIDAKELKAAMRALGFQVKKAEVRKMIEGVAREEAGTIEFEHFTDIMTGRMGDRDSKEEIAKVFALFDHEGTGKISFRDLKVSRGAGRRRGARRARARAARRGVGQGGVCSCALPPWAPAFPSVSALAPLALLPFSPATRLTHPHARPSRAPPRPQRVVTELGESIPDDELREMVEEADRDQDGFVVFEDFYRIMKKPGDDDDDVRFGGWLLLQRVGGGLWGRRWASGVCLYLPLVNFSRLSCHTRTTHTTLPFLPSG